MMASQVGMVITGWLQNNALQVNKGLNYIIIEN